MSLGWYATEDELRQEVEKALVWIDFKILRSSPRPGCFVSYEVKSGEIRKGIICSIGGKGIINAAIGIGFVYFMDGFKAKAFQSEFRRSVWVKSKQLGQPWSTQRLRWTCFSYAFLSRFLDIALLEFSPAEVPWFEEKGVVFLQMDGCARFYPGDKLCCCRTNDPSRKRNERLNFSDGQVVAVPQPWIVYDWDLTSVSNGSPLLKLAHKNDQCTYQLFGIHPGDNLSSFNETLSWGTSNEAIMDAIHADRRDMPIKYSPFPDPDLSDDELICMLFNVDMAAAKDLDPPISKVTQGRPLYSDDVFYTLECDRGVRISVKPTKWENLFTLMYARDSRFKFVPWRKFSVEEFKGFYKLAAALWQNQGSEWLKAVENYLRDSSKADLAEFFSPGQIIEAVDNIKWLVMTKDGPRKLAQAIIETEVLPQQKEEICAKLAQFKCNAVTEAQFIVAIADCFQKLATTQNTAEHQSRFQTDFEVIEELGSGAFGTVWKCKNKLDGRLYAVKQIRVGDIEKDMAKALSEVQTLAKLNHHGIVRYYTPWTAQEDHFYLYIQMELCDTSLDKWLDGQANCTRDHNLMLNWFNQLACALQYVHKNDTIHRDLKPANIFISVDKNDISTLKIGDFGLAKQEKLRDDEQQSLSSQPVHTAGAGTPLYMAPEQRGIWGQRLSNYSFPVDVFALGLIFVEMFVRLKTKEERNLAFGQIRQNHTLPDEFNKMPDLGNLVKLMTLRLPEGRVKIRDVVKSVQDLKLI